ncbi:glutathione S-transferase family protein [Alkalilimnicola sp. S0819]|uniref:glutathione S-transferase family protein n=1 Tax=Alkalilimnicola sp. S0819 TaxID=2613922 RepID=UPI0012619212|nr:glutathione S-transferase family protein [Alkalilimnicola sp. S0819]KAB7623350.1 glutathione S-transferase family protein [Alkalilimnicola sp. S0819]MPQ16889.1 hypothetical protein [Alkalilimnicola sp. S0819]
MSETLRMIDKPECPFCWRVRMAAALQGRKVAHLNREDPVVLAEWERLSPNRTVPVLIDGDFVLTESMPMLEYLAETGTALLPDAPRARAEARNLVYYADNPLGKATKTFVFEKRDKPESEWDQALIDAGVAAYHAALPALEQRLGAQEYFSGKAPGLADCALWPRFALAELYGEPIPREYKQLRAWYVRLASRNDVLSAAPEKFRALYAA